MPNGTSAVRVSGDDVIRINLVNGAPVNAYGILNGKFVMGNMQTGSSLVPAGGVTTILGLPSPASTSAGASPAVNVTARTGTIWDNITPTANYLENTYIPATYKLMLDSDIKYVNPTTGLNEVWINSNASKHMGII